ncbi:MAG TPA: glycoside hydrolase family 28 protein [Phycisphaerae bacterium]|nr:glycoside hydrolase family 28 protein [Phycisphaerae bacterium]
MLAACTHGPTTGTLPERTFNVRQFGALGDGKTKDTAALQKALDACIGGGKVLLPPGDYLSGSLQMYSNTILYLSDGATLHGSPDAADYPIIPLRFEGAAVQGHQALISATDADNIGIEGPGTLQGDEKIGDLRSPRAPVMVEFTNCKNIRLIDFKDRYRRMWSIHLLFCDHVLAQGLHIRTTLNNGDGIDVESTTNVHVDHCDMDTGDDCIALKSGRGADGVRIGRPTEHVLITDCKLGSHFAGVALGTEMSGGVRDVAIRRCEFTRGANSIFIKSRIGRSGYMTDVDASDLTSSATTLLGIDLINKGIVGADPVPGDAGVPLAANIRIAHAKCNDVGWIVDGAHISPIKPLEGLMLSDITGTAKRGIYLENVKNAALSDIHVAVSQGVLLNIRNVSGTGLEGAVPLPPPATKPGK